jgi:hypothetical protein
MEVDDLVSDLYRNSEARGRESVQGRREKEREIK